MHLHSPRLSLRPNFAPWSQSPIRTFVINDNVRLLDELSQFLLLQSSIELAGISSDLEEAAEDQNFQRAQLIILGLSMRRAGSLSTVRQVRLQLPEAAIILTSATRSPRAARLCQAHGADDLVCKSRFRRELGPAVQRLVAQRTDRRTLPSPPFEAARQFAC